MRIDLYKILLRGRFACLRWNVMWKGAERAGVSVAGFSNPGSSTHPPEIQLGRLGIRVDKLRVSLMGNFEQMQLQEEARMPG